MVRPYGIKGGNKRKNRDKYDRLEELQQSSFIEEEEEEEEDDKVTAKKLKNEAATTQEEEEKAEAVLANELAGIPIVPSDHNSNTGVVFILEKASLEVAKVGKTYQLLNSDDHANFLRRNNRNPAEYRPDIAHQAILTILDSPVNKSGRLRALYVRTEKVLIEIDPHVRIPRTYKRFSGVMLQLLQKFSITAVGTRKKLMRVIKNPVTQYLPINSRKIGFSFSSEKLVDMRDYVASVNDDVNLVFVVGAMAHGKIDKEYVDDFVSVSGYPLSAAYCISRICNALEQKWKIV